jgi:hypothetical protein
MNFQNESNTIFLRNERLKIQNKRLIQLFLKYYNNITYIANFENIKNKNDLIIENEKLEKQNKKLIILLRELNNYRIHYEKYNYNMLDNNLIINITNNEIEK